tara:strand:+ start:57 stop:800 length:744 start_codon:yes stop_codon:yes gene_type:complete
MIKLNKIIQWVEDNNLIYKLNPNYSLTHLIESPWNIKESNSHNISFITKGWINNTAGVVFTTEIEEPINSLLVIITDNPKYYFVKCINKFFKPNKCVITKGKNVQIGENCSIGNDGFQYIKDPMGDLIKFPHFGNVIIEDNVEIANNVCIDRGALSNTIIHKGAKIDNLVHIAHNVEIGENTMVIALAMVAGSVKIGKNCWISPSSCIKNKITIGDNVLIGMGAVVIKDVESNSVMIGNPAKLLRKQ